MKKVLVLAYNFPPSTRASANRAKAWAMYMHEFGYYPVIITRHWDDISQVTFKDDNRACGSTIEIDKHSTYEVHYLPYKPNGVVNATSKYSKKPWFKLYSKVYFFLKQFFIFYSNVFIEYSNFQQYADSILKKDAAIKKMVVTVFPVYLLKFAHFLSKKHKVSWVADYRDDWNTSDLTEKPKKVVGKIANKLAANAEKKWLNSACYISSVSDGYVEKLELFLNKKNKGITLSNGFFEEEMEKYKDSKLYEEFTITYNGTLYKSQPIEVFLEAFKQLVEEFPDKKIQARFPGITNEVGAVERIKKHSLGIESSIVISDRIPKEEVLEMQAKSDLLLMVGHIGIDDIPSSKIYEYIGLNKKVLICPTDNGVIENTLSDVGLAIGVSSVSEAYNTLKTELLNRNRDKRNLENKEKAFKYSRRYQTKLLCNLLDSM